MKLNQVPNFRVEDFESQKEWIGRLFISLNPFISSVNQVLDKSIDYIDNIKSVTKEYDQTVVSFQPFDFTWDLKGVTPVDLRVVKALKGSTLTPTILLAAWQYSASTSLISVSQMVELSTSGVSALSGRYQFTIRVTI